MQDIKQGVQIHDITDQLRGTENLIQNVTSPQMGVVSEFSPQTDVTTVPEVTSPQSVNELSDPNLSPTSTLTSEDQPVTFGTLDADEMSHFTIPVVRRP